MVTVITPTIRPQGLELNYKGLKRQSINWEWIIISPLDITLEDKRVKILKDPPKNEGDYWTFNKAMNEAIRQSKGDIIVSLQDFTFINPEGLEKYQFYLNTYPKIIISGIGDKYSDDTFTNKIWTDPRRDENPLYECSPWDIEFNYCALKKDSFYEVGGFDEYLDKYSGMDHISVQERLYDIGYKFYIDQTNESYSLTHDRIIDWDENHAMHGGYEQRKRYLKNKKMWPKLEYLKR